MSQRTARLVSFGPLFAAALAFGVALVFAAGIAGLGDTDPYRHLEYAHQLWKSHFALHGHPFLPYTLLGTSGVDLWLGFHWLLIPFTALGTLWGARLAGATVAGVQAYGLAALLRRAGQPKGWIFALLPLAISPDFAFRDHLARPSHLTVPLILINLLAGTGALAPGWAAAAALVHGLLHLSSPLSPLFALIGLLGARLAKQAGSGRAIIWSACGLAAALVLRPDRFDYLNVAALTDLGAMGFFTNGRIPHTGMELFPIPIGRLLEEIWPGLLLLFLAMGLGKGRGRCGEPGLRTAAQLALGLSLVLTLRSGRFLDYLVPLLAFNAGLLWPRELPADRLWRPLSIAASCIAVALLARNVQRGWVKGSAFIDPPQVFAAMAKEVRAIVPPGTMLFGDDLFLTAVLYASLPEYKYTLAYDPSLLYLADPQLFWAWHHAVVDGIACDEPACPGRSPSPDQIAEAMHAFHTDWAITSYPSERFSMQRVMQESPSRFELVAHIPGPVTGLYLWHSLGSG